MGQHGVEVVDGSQDGLDVKLLTCRWRLTDHSTKTRPPIDLRERAKLDCDEQDDFMVYALCAQLLSIGDWSAEEMVSCSEGSLRECSK